MNSLQRCKDKLPMPDLWRALGLPGDPKRSMKSPFREDKEESFSVFERDGKWFFKDHAREDVHGDEVTLIELARSLDNREAIKFYHDLAGIPWGGAGGGPDRSQGSKKGKKNPAIRAEEPRKPSPPSKPRQSTDFQPAWAINGVLTKGDREYQISKIYDYLDENGVVLHQTVRLSWESKEGDRKDKTFRQRRRPEGKETPAPDGWVYFLEGITPVLYRLPELLEADDSEPIFLVEGEKDADLLRDLGLLSTTVPMGAGKWDATYSLTLRGKWVVVLGDNDQPGRDHVNKACKELKTACKRLGAVALAEKWPECPEKADVTDWLDFCGESPGAIGVSDSAEDEEFRNAAALVIRGWADTARAPESIRYSHCFSYGERGAVKVHQDELAGILIEERVAKFAGEEWWQWEQTRWKRLDVQREPRRWAMEAIRSHLDARRDMTSYMVNSVEDLMANRCAMHPDRFNSHDPDLINVGNGMLNMRNFTLSPHDPKYLSTVQVPHRFDQKAECPLFLKWLGEMLPAEDVQLGVQEIFGYCLAPQLNYHKFFFFYGDGGTGKSTLIEVLRKLIGADNAIAIRLQDLDNPFVRAQLVGRRLYLATELNRDSFKHIDLIKAIVSGDPIHVEKKHKDGYTYLPQGRFIMASNVRAQTGDTTEGFFRRLYQVTFENKIPDDQKDYELLAKFEAEMDGILSWALEGLHRLIARGRFETTKDSAKAAEQIAMHRSSAKSFWEHCIEPTEDPTAVVLCTERIFDEYKTWCQWEQVKPHFENHEYLSRELTNRLPYLRDHKVRKANFEYDGNKARRMCYRGFRFRTWEPADAETA